MKPIKRSLTNVGGDISIAGDRSLATMLAHALDVPTTLEAENLARSHVHGFHTYPARMHPLTAQRLIEAFSKPKDTVLDPFCGSGTVLVEARLLGRKAFGSDLNPLAIRLAQMKTRPYSKKERDALLTEASAIAAFADERRAAKKGPVHRYKAEDLDLFERYILLELDSLREGIDHVSDSTIRSTLYLVLSSLLVKMSRKASDTSEERITKRLRAGFPAAMFIRKVNELVNSLESIETSLTNAPRCSVCLDDARKLQSISDHCIDLVVSSPPYPGNYDYLKHHQLRFRWLGLNAKSLLEHEIGSRRQAQHGTPLGALMRWRNEFTEVLNAIHPKIKRHGQIILFMADSTLNTHPVFVLDEIAHLAPKANLVLIATASQYRPHFHQDSIHAFKYRPRGEHAILLSAHGHH